MEKGNSHAIAESNLNPKLNPKEIAAMTKNHIEIQRNNVTVAEFLRYIKRRCTEKGMDFYLSRDDFEKPYSEYHSSYNVIDGIKKCHFAEYRTTTEWRRKLASYKTSEGYDRFYYTNDFEDYEVTKLHRWSNDGDGSDAPCKSEICRTFAYDHQTYVLNWDGSCYNEIIEFTFHDEKTGYGYYYQANVDAE